MSRDVNTAKATKLFVVVAVAVIAIVIVAVANVAAAVAVAAAVVAANLPTTLAKAVFCRLQSRATKTLNFCCKFESKSKWK